VAPGPLVVNDDQISSKERVRLEPRKGDHVSRNKNLVGVLLGGMLVLSGFSTAAGSGEQELQTVQAMTFPGQAYRGPILIADDQGFFAARGIQVETVPQPANVSGIQGLEATGSDVGYFSVPTLTQAVQAGTDVVFICGNISVYEPSLMAAADSDLPSVDEGATAEEVFTALAEVEDLTIGVQTPIGSGLQLFSQQAFENHGIEGATYIATGTQGPIILAALDNGDVDVAMVSPTATQQMLVDGTVRRLMYMPAVVPELQLYGSAIGALRSWAEENPELARGYCDAIAEATEFILDPANADVVDPILMEDAGISEEVVALVKEESYPEYSIDIPEDVYNDTVQTYIDLGVMEPEPAIDYAATVLIPPGGQTATSEAPGGTGETEATEAAGTTGG
jgi:ABC-type nitrate/sulfonate/bicarbonate transport system substrate-binding protein